MKFTLVLVYLFLFLVNAQISPNEVFGISRHTLWTRGKLIYHYWNEAEAYKLNGNVKSLKIEEFKGVVEDDEFLPDLLDTAFELNFDQSGNLIFEKASRYFDQTVEQCIERCYTYEYEDDQLKRKMFSQEYKDEIVSVTETFTYNSGGKLEAIHKELGNGKTSTMYFEYENDKLVKVLSSQDDSSLRLFVQISYEDNMRIEEGFFRNQVEVGVKLLFDDKGNLLEEILLNKPSDSDSLSLFYHNFYEHVDIKGKPRPILVHNETFIPGNEGITSVGTFKYDSNAELVEFIYRDENGDFGNGIKCSYLEIDSAGNWTKRMCIDILHPGQDSESHRLNYDKATLTMRTIEYY